MSANPYINLLRILLLLTVFVACTGGYARAQDEGSLLGTTELLTLSAESVQPCYVHLPVDYDPGKEYPLLIGLHGYGSNIERFHTNWFAFDDPQFIYACPQAPYPTIQSYGLGFGWFLSGTGDSQVEMQAIAMTSEYAVATIDRLRQQYRIGEVYALGFSQGAMLALLISMEHPDRLSGIGFLSSRLDLWLDNGVLLSSLPDRFRVFSSHGTLDEDVKVEFGREARDRLTELGVRVEYSEFEGGHTILAATLREFQIWMTREIESE